MKYHVKKGDKVLVNSGNYKGEEATIKAVITKNDRVVLEFTSKKDRAIGKRAIKKSVRRQADCTGRGCGT